MNARLGVAAGFAYGAAADIEPVFTEDTRFPHVRASVLRETPRPRASDERPPTPRS